MTDDLQIDFTAKSFVYRMARISKREHLIRAVGLKAGADLTVLDATAGLGRDGFLLAAAGAKVILIERSPQICEALRRGLDTAHAHSEGLAEITGRITLTQGDAREMLPSMKASMKTDVILVDPMHPERKKSALVKENMRKLRDIVGTDPDSAELIHAALKNSPGRVVVKWPRHAGLPIGLPKPGFILSGQSVRHYVFVEPVRK